MGALNMLNTLNSVSTFNMFNTRSRPNVREIRSADPLLGVFRPGRRAAAQKPESDRNQKRFSCPHDFLVIRKGPH
ncbi:hypothetical protein BRPE64_ACDS10560 [Caballeronia insecticola]|uniref:Uncharacterized protein n=1 Tax=Caballeronia insecticola TaxID=758793 RepID=R4WPM1_9BURK|nr:hypothetical protein BRPE64_ACDS10560 [Caballeronia insecticola]